MQSLKLLLCVGICLNLVEESEQRISQISPSVYEKLNNIKNITQFVNTFISNKRTLPSALRMNAARNMQVQEHPTSQRLRVNNGGTSQPSGDIAINDVCEPKLSSIKIPQSDPSILLWPTCTKLNQCGGCCGSNIFECTPTKKVKLSLKVMRCRPTSPGSDDFTVVGLKTLTFEEHQQCECKCKTKITHCDLSKHVYLPHECRCKCKNEQEAAKCKSPMKWDHTSCRCVCREIYHCHPDEDFSHGTCRCEMKNIGKSAASTDSGSSWKPCASVRCRRGYKKLRNNSRRCRCVASTSSRNRTGGNSRSRGRRRPRSRQTS